MSTKTMTIPRRGPEEVQRTLRVLSVYAASLGTRFLSAYRPSKAHLKARNRKQSPSANLNTAPMENANCSRVRHVAFSYACRRRNWKSDLAPSRLKTLPRWRWLPSHAHRRAGFFRRSTILCFSGCHNRWSSFSCICVSPFLHHVAYVSRSVLWRRRPS